MRIDDLRNGIDGVDAELVKLLAERFRLAREIGLLKKEAGQPVTDSSREARVMGHIAALARQQGLDPDEVESIYRQVIAASRGIQSQVIAFQGEYGAYSQEAAMELFGCAVDARPYETLEDVFRAVEQGQADFGVVPVENSLEGSISRTYDLLLDSSLRVCGESELRVSHCLIANTGASLEGVRRVFSHPQALGQCRAFFKHRDIETVPAYDTAGSVKMIKERGWLDAAAIASARSAGIYGMQILLRAIEDNPYNFTRFFVLGKEDCPPTGDDKTSLVFSVKHQPGSLFGFLGELAGGGINLTKIESRPTRRKAWDYNFYLDFEGHRRDAAFIKVLPGLEQYASFIKILGSYPRSVSAGKGQRE